MSTEVLVRPDHDRPVIGVDLDDMIADYTASSLAVIQCALGPNEAVCRDNHIDYYVNVCFGEEAGKVVDEAMTKPQFWISIPPIPGACKALMNLMQLFDVHIITARPLQFADLTKYWLCMHEIPFDRLTLVESRDEKPALVEKDGCVAFLDDHQGTAEQMRDMGLVAGQLAHPWNVGGRGIVRSPSWEQLSLEVAQQVTLKLNPPTLF